MKYTVKRNDKKLTSGTADICDMMGQKHSGKAPAILQSFGFPNKCPVDKVKSCLYD